MRENQALAALDAAPFPLVGLAGSWRGERYLVGGAYGDGDVSQIVLGHVDGDGCETLISSSVNEDASLPYRFHRDRLIRELTGLNGVAPEPRRKWIEAPVAVDGERLTFTVSPDPGGLLAYGPVRNVLVTVIATTGLEHLELETVRQRAVYAHGFRRRTRRP